MVTALSIFLGSAIPSIACGLLGAGLASTRENTLSAQYNRHRGELDAAWKQSQEGYQHDLTQVSENIATGQLHVKRTDNVFTGPSKDIWAACTSEGEIKANIQLDPARESSAWIVPAEQRALDALRGQFSSEVVSLVNPETRERQLTMARANTNVTGFLLGGMLGAMITLSLSEMIISAAYGIGALVCRRLEKPEVQVIVVR